MTNTSKAYRLNDSLGHLASRFSRQILRRVNAEFVQRGLPITADQYSLLVQLWEHDGLPQGALAEKSAKDKTAMARLAPELEGKGLLVRRPGPTDARERLLYLTDTGKDLMEAATAIVKEILDDARQGIADNELEICRDVLRRAFANLAK
jgi:DNA-binding MarR family transcriptional regulator